MAEETFSFPRRTNACTLAFVTKIVCSLVALARRRVADKLSIFGVAPMTNSSQIGSATGGNGATEGVKTSGGVA